MEESSNSGRERGEIEGEMVGKLSWPLWADWLSPAVGGSAWVGKRSLQLLISCIIIRVLYFLHYYYVYPILPAICNIHYIPEGEIIYMFTRQHLPAELLALQNEEVTGSKALDYRSVILSSISPNGMYI